MKQDGIKTDLPPSLVRRVAQGMQYIVSGVTPGSWFGPQQPMQPEAQQTQGRQLDYPVGYNIRISPRSDENISFEQLRALADAYDLLRLVIETRKDQIAKFDWSIKAKEGRTVSQARLKELTDFYQKPDREHDWDEWLRALLEDMLVIDAATLYPRKTLGGQLYALELVDGATIKRVIDDDGRTPPPPSPAYQQILKGIPASDYTYDELIYRPRNVRSNKIYGYSPVEQIIITVNTAIRRQLHQLQYYTEGNVPEMIFALPAEWNVDQVKTWQEWWDSLLSGDTAQRRHARFVPGGKDFSAIMTKEGALKDEMDEWLARIVCYAFSVSPTPFVKQMNRATAQTAHMAALQEGLIPIQSWVKRGRDYELATYHHEPDAEFCFVTDEEEDPLQQAQVHKIYLEEGTLTDDEVREDLGREPLTDEQREKMKPEPIKPPTVAADDKRAAGDPANGGKEPPAGTQAATDGNPKPADKLHKGVKRLAPIPFDRPATVKARKDFVEQLTAFLSTAGEDLARQVVALLHSEKVKKSAEDDLDDEVRRILNELDLEGWDVLVDPAEQVLQRVTQDSGYMAAKQLSLDTDALHLVNERAAKWAEQNAAELVSEISDSTKEMLRSIITQALEEGPSAKELAQQIQDSTAFSAARAGLIAETELRNAHNAGQLAGYQAAADLGIELKKTWERDGDEDCPVCEENEAAGPIDVDDTFPSGDDAPTAHPNCECYLIAEVTDERYAIDTDPEHIDAEPALAGINKRS